MAAVLLFFKTTVGIVSLPAILVAALVVKAFPGLRDLYFPYLCSRYGRYACLEALKEGLFADLKKIKSRDVQLFKHDSVRILELGIGDGKNFDYFPPNVNLIALDINKKVEKYLMKSLDMYPTIKLEKLIIASAEDLSEVSEESVDAVISTHGMCGVDDQKRSLDQVKRVLVKGGKFFFLEHVPYPEKTAGNRIQRMVNPLWRTFFGCSLLNPINSSLSEAGFVDISTHFKQPNELWYVWQPHIYGTATKSFA